MGKIAQYRCSISQRYCGSSRLPNIENISVLGEGKTYYHSVLIWNNTEPFAAAELKHFPKLKMFINWGTDDCNLDERPLREHGIAIRKIDSYATEALAEYIIYLMLMFERRYGQLQIDERFIGGELYRKKVGIIGMGKIGSRVASILKDAFFCDVSYASRANKKIGEYRLSSIEKLFATCDYVIITVKSRDFVISADVLHMTNANIVIINISRDSVLPLRTLLPLLNQQKIRGFVGDLEIDKVPEQLPDNVLLTPRRGYLTDKALRAKHDVLLSYLKTT